MNPKDHNEEEKKEGYWNCNTPEFTYCKHPGCKPPQGKKDTDSSDWEERFDAIFVKHSDFSPNEYITDPHPRRIKDFIKTLLKEKEKKTQEELGKKIVEALSKRMDTPRWIQDQKEMTGDYAMIEAIKLIQDLTK